MGQRDPTPLSLADHHARALHRLRIERAARHVHRLGARPLAELLIDLTECAGPVVLDRLAAFERLSPATVERVGGDRFAPQPLHVVPQP